jgi:hypothetical protein
MAYEDINFSPPAGVRAEAQQGLDWRSEYGRGGTAIGIARGRDLSNGTTISADTAKRMKAYFDRHEVDKQGEGYRQSEPGFPSAGRIAWALWGGDPGYSWAKKLVRQIDAEDARSFHMDIERRDISFEEAPEAELMIETRASGQTAIVGYAAVYNRLSLDLGGGLREMILPGAFDKVLARQRGKQDVVAVFNHDPNYLLGRTSSGTLELSSDEKGLKYSVMPPATRADILELINRRDVKGSSFAFTVSKDGESYASDAGGAVRSIREVSGLYDVGPVVNPAYPSSTSGIAMRSYEAWKLQQEQPAIEDPAVVVLRSWKKELALMWREILLNVRR